METPRGGWGVQREVILSFSSFFFQGHLELDLLASHSGSLHSSFFFPILETDFLLQCLESVVTLLVTASFPVVTLHLQFMELLCTSILYNYPILSVSSVFLFWVGTLTDTHITQNDKFYKLKFHSLEILITVILEGVKSIFNKPWHWEVECIMVKNTEFRSGLLVCDFHRVVMKVSLGNICKCPEFTVHHLSTGCYYYHYYNKYALKNEIFHKVRRT